MQKSHISGLTLMELIASLAIISAVIIGALALYSVATSSQQSQKLLKDIVSLKLNTQKLFATTRNYGDIDGEIINGTLISANIIPLGIAVDNNTLSHSYGGIINVRTRNQGRNLQIGLTNIPQDACIFLLTSARDWESVDILPSSTVYTGADFPVSVDLARNSCNSPANVIWFTTDN